MIAGFRNGEVDIATDLQDSDLPKVEDLGDEVSSIDSLTYEYLRPNWSDLDAVDTEQGVGGCSKNPAVADRGNGCPMADPAMREALAYAVDKNEINDRLLGGLAQVANTFVSPSAWFYVDQTPATYDPDKAREILEAAGWVDTDGDGIREKNGLRAKIEMCTTTRQIRQDTLALLAGWLKDVGIDTIINPVDATNIFADYNESTADTPCVLSHGNFDLAEHATSSSIDPLGNYFSYHSSQFNPIGVNNASVNDPGVDEAMDRVKNSVDFAEIKDAMGDLQQIYVEKAVEVPLYYRKQVDLHAPRLGNFFANPTQAGPTWNVVDWFASELTGPNTGRDAGIPGVPPTTRPIRPARGPLPSGMLLVPAPWSRRVERNGSEGGGVGRRCPAPFSSLSAPRGRPRAPRRAPRSGPAAAPRAGGWRGRGSGVAPHRPRRGPGRPARSPRPCPPRATMRPHGSTIIECPQAGIAPGPPAPQPAAAITQAPFSMARARSSTSQWSRPVRSVNTAGTAITAAPASASARYSSGKRRS